MVGMLGVLVNTGTVLVGSLVGLLLKKGIPERVSQGIMVAIGLCTMYIGIDGALKGENTLVLIVSMVVGTLIGTLLDLDGKLNRLGNYVEKKMRRPGEKTSVAEGFVTACLLFCIGAMTIVGSLQAGMTGDNELIFTKATLDLISSCMLASTLGIGVTLSAVFVFVFQGALVLLGMLLKNWVIDEAMIAEITCAGSVMIIGLGFNIVGLSKFKIINMLPAVALVPLVYWAAQFLPL
ncbi:MAG: DUF554 domain-containing protein [Oscillospiraceae bacterium]|nr:DUF554 domain-containing protein [Oscillospiraceae bacterium]